MFITFGDTFLPSPTSYDELYYEIIRMAQVFDNLYTVGKQSYSSVSHNHCLVMRLLVAIFMSVATILRTVARVPTQY